MNNKKQERPISNLDNWNDRLDENLEKPASGNPKADERAEEFNHEFGSDAKRNSHTLDAQEIEDNMRVNQSKPGSPAPGEIAREE